MTMKPPTLEKPISVEAQVRKLKEDHAAQHGYDPDLIALAAREWEAKHPERMADSVISSNIGGAD
jgi:hypothetical protein